MPKICEFSRRITPTSYKDFRYTNKPYAECVGQCVSYKFINFFENMCQGVPEQCQKLVQSAQTIFCLQYILHSKKIYNFS